MVIEIDFQSDEALYTQLMNQIIMGIATSLPVKNSEYPKNKRTGVIQPRSLPIFRNKHFV